MRSQAEFVKEIGQFESKKQDVVEAINLFNFKITESMWPHKERAARALTQMSVKGIEEIKFMTDCSDSRPEQLVHACDAVSVMLQDDTKFDLVEYMLHHDGVPIEISQFNPMTVNDATIRKIKNKYTRFPNF